MENLLKKETPIKNRSKDTYTKISSYQKKIQ